jgi:predicted enzyme related to lactoylglutathione lyase
MHDVCHVEFMSKNMPRLVEFYCDLFEWKKSLDTPTYVILAPKEGPGIGIGPAMESQPAPAITNYVLVKDIAVTLKKVRSYGLEILQEKTEVPGMGWFGLFKDPDGNVIGLWTTLPRFLAAARSAGKQEKKAAKKPANKPPKKAAKKSARPKKAAKKASKKGVKKSAKSNGRPKKKVRARG